VQSERKVNENHPAQPRALSLNRVKVVQYPVLFVSTQAGISSSMGGIIFCFLTVRFAMDTISVRLYNWISQTGLEEECGRGREGIDWGLI
jgi:hypothetical protein